MPDLKWLDEIEAGAKEAMIPRCISCGTRDPAAPPTGYCGGYCGEHYFLPASVGIGEAERDFEAAHLARLCRIARAALEFEAAANGALDLLDGLVQSWGGANYFPVRDRLREATKAMRAAFGEEG